MEDNQQGINEVENNSLQDFIEKYFSYWPLFVSLLFISVLVAFVVLRYKTPIYQADASILIKSEESAAGKESILDQLNLGGEQKNIQNEIELLKSRPLAKNIVTNLHLYAPITLEANIRVMSAYTASPVIFTVPFPDTIRVGTNKIYFTYNPVNHTVKIGQQNYSLNDVVNTPYGTIKILPNPHYSPVDHDYAMYFSIIPVNAIVSSLQNSMAVTTENRQSTVVNLTCKDESKERASDVLNQLVQVYNEAAINDKNKLAANTLRFIKDRLNFVMNELDSVERSLEQYKFNNRIVDISVQGEEYLKNVGLNDGRLTEVNMQLAALDEVQKYVSSKRNTTDAIVPSVLGMADPVLTSLLQRLYDAEAKQSQLRETMGENYPSFSSLTEEINRIRPTILENIKNLRASLQASRNDIVATNNKYNVQLSSLPAQERNLINISRQQSIKNTIYTFLLQKREETELSFASTVADNRLVNDVQVNPNPVSPNSRNTYLIAVAVAFATSVLFIFIRENLNRSIISRNEIEKLISVPIIAEIAHNKNDKSIVVEQGSNTIIAEQFRYLRTSLNYIGINTRKKKLLFTSSISGEGKSFITINLGATLALTGKKVIMLEMDLRKPKLSSMLDIERNVGLSDYLIGSKSLQEVVKSTFITNLSIITSGVIPPNPAELLSGGRLSELFLDLESTYDYVLIDTAPIGPVTDAYIISPLCDATLYVVRQSITPKIMVQKLTEISRHKRLKNLSIIYNGVKYSKFNSYYGHGYAYSYGYIERDNKKKSKRSSI